MSNQISDISDLFPVYPEVKDPEFNCKINAKKEFSTMDKSGKYHGRLFYHQELIRRFMNPYTGYKDVLLYHDVGTGKSGTMIAVMEDYMEVEGYGKPLILVKGDTQQVNIKEEIIKFSNFSKRDLQDKKYATRRGRNIAFSKDINKYYEIDNYQSFSNKIRDLLNQKNGEEEIRKLYNKRVIAIDEAHNLRSVSGKKEAYFFIHKFLHIVKDCRIILATATPMVDNVYEIASIMNLMLPMEEQMTVKDIKKIIDNKNLSEEEIKKALFNYLEPKFRGRVSYVRQPASMPKRINMGEPFKIEKGIKTVAHIVTHQMSEHQASVYVATLEKEKPEDLASLEDKLDDLEQKESTFAINSRYSLNFAFPATKNNPNPKYTDYVEEIQGIPRFKDPEFGKSLENINILKKYSTKYAGIIQRSLDNPKIQRYIYTHYVNEFGANLLGLCFQTQGFEFYSGATPLTTLSTKKKRFAIIGTKTTKDQIRNIINAANMKGNEYGDYLQIIIGSPRSGEGISFLNVRAIDIIEPGWNESETRQTIGRGFRATSQLNFPEEERFVQVSFHAAIYKGKSPEEDIIFTKDIEMYYLSELKAAKIQLIESIMKFTAFDCKINSFRNQRDVSNPQCYGCDPSLPDDYSSYHMLYSEDIFTALEYDLRKLYVQYFSLTFDQLSSLLSQYHPSSILIVLNKLIEYNLMIKNRYGFLCYLRNDQDIYYLQQSNSIGLSRSNFLNSVYTETLFITDPIKLSDYLYPINVKKAQSFLSTTQNFSSSQFRDSFLELSMDLKIILLEKSLVDSSFLSPSRRSLILSIMSNNWFLFEDSNCVVHILEQLNLDRVHYTANITKLTPQGKLKKYCYNSDNPHWFYLSGRDELEYINAINDLLEQKEDEISRIHPIYGILNTSDNVFRVKDLTKISGRSKSDGTSDRRRDVRGFSCKDSSKPTLIRYLIHFNLKPPVTDTTLSSSDIKRFLKNKLSDVNLNELSSDQLSLYYLWYESSIQQMCETLQQHFQDIGALFIK